MTGSWAFFVWIGFCIRPSTTPAITDSYPGPWLRMATQWTCWRWWRAVLLRLRGGGSAGGRAQHGRPGAEGPEDYRRAESRSPLRAGPQPESDLSALKAGDRTFFQHLQGAGRARDQHAGLGRSGGSAQSDRGEPGSLSGAQA